MKYINQRWALKLLLMALITTLFTSCTVDYTKQVVSDSLKSVNLKDKHKLHRQHYWVLSTNTSVYLSHVEVVGEKEKSLSRTKNMLAIELASRFNEAFPNLTLGRQKHTLNGDLRLAKNNGAAILVQPRFVKFNNQANTAHEMKFRKLRKQPQKINPDEVVLQFMIYDVNSGQLIDYSSVHSLQRLLADDDSQTADLFSGAIRVYLEAISGVPVS